MENNLEPVAVRYRHNPTGAFSVDWYVGKRCNYSCSYCVDYLHDSHSPHVPLENMKQLVDLIYKQNGTNVLWSLSGGEPTVNPHFVELCKYIYEEKGCANISITTNGSRTADYFKQLFQYLDNITLSFHFEFMAERADEFVERCIEIENWRRQWNEENKDHVPANKQKSLLLRFMVYPEMFKLAKSMEERFIEHGITNIEHRYIRLPGKRKGLQPTRKFEFGDSKDPNQVRNKDVIEKIEKRESQFYGSENLTKLKNIYTQKKKSTKTQKKQSLEQWSIDNNNNYSSEHMHYNEFNFNKQNQFENWICWAGIKHLKIAPNGDIYVGNCHVGGLRGNIYNPDSIDLPTEPIRCTKWRCTDNTDLRVPKIKDWEHYHIIKDEIEWTPKQS